MQKYKLHIYASLFIFKIIVLLFCFPVLSLDVVYLILSPPFLPRASLYCACCLTVFGTFPGSEFWGVPRLCLWGVLFQSLKFISFILFLRRAINSQESSLTADRRGWLSVHQAITPFYSLLMTMLQRLPGLSGFSLVPQEIEAHIGNLSYTSRIALQGLPWQSSG